MGAGFWFDIHHKSVEALTLKQVALGRGLLQHPPEGLLAQGTSRWES